MRQLGSCSLHAAQATKRLPPLHGVLTSTTSISLLVRPSSLRLWSSCAHRTSTIQARRWKIDRLACRPDYLLANAITGIGMDKDGTTDAPRAVTPQQQLQEHQREDPPNGTTSSTGSTSPTKFKRRKVNHGTLPLVQRPAQV